VADYEKPLPQPTLDTEPYWDAARRHELVVQRCAQCGYLRFPPRPVCPRCQSMQSDWTPLSGRGTLYTFSVVAHPVGKGFRNDVPYVNALVEPVEQQGCRIPTNLVETDPEQVKIGMAVEVVFADVTPEVTLPKFRPAAKKRS
jgi:uncharacterized OB-fold protein